MRRSILSSQHSLSRTGPALSLYRPPTSIRSLVKPATSQSTFRPHLNRHIYTKARSKNRDPGPGRIPLQSSWSTYTFVLVLACGSIYAFDLVTRAPEHVPSPPPADAGPSTSSDPFFTNMPVPQGHRGNLTADQEAKLRELWALTLKTFGVTDPTLPNGTSTPTPSEEPKHDASTEKKKKSRMSIFSSKKHDSPSPSHTPKPADDSDDKYGQVKEYQQILATQTPESLRAAFWSMVKSDHPDALLLRFLRARKWDVNKALVMLISTMSWRGNEMHVDDDVIFHGEGGALRDSKSSDPAVAREGKDFLEQMRLGKSFLHGTDKEGRPLCFVRARLHHGGDQTERSMERYTVYVIETARLVLRPPVETATILFDMTHFTMANMDYTPVKFMIKIFEANYPESLGAVLVHKSPWLFQGIWKIIKGWLDPVVASKVHFTSSVEDLEHFIPRSQIIKELGGDEDWEYVFVEPKEGEDEGLKDEAKRAELKGERERMVQQYERDTFEWLRDSAEAEAKGIKDTRDALAGKLNENYWRLDPLVRARTLYDRVGMLEEGGKVNFYPSHVKAKEQLEGVAPATTAGTGTVTPKVEGAADAKTSADDVD